MRRFEILLLLLCLLASYVLFSFTLRTNADTADGEFQKITDDSLGRLETRMATYLQSLNGTAAFLDASETVSMEEFDDFVQTLRIREFLPGINGIGLIEPVTAGQEPALVDRQRALGADDFSVFPDTESAERFVITRISPMAPNKEAFGLDITFEEGRRNAAISARTSKEPRLTPRILLVQDKTQEPGFLLLRPLFGKSTDDTGAVVDEDAFVGWVYAPFVGRNLLNNLSSSQGRSYHLRVYDGPDPDPETLIYETDGAADAQSRFTKDYNVNIYGRAWTVAYSSTRRFEAPYQSLFPVAVLGVCLLLTAMLMFSIYNLRVRSEALQQVADIRAKEVSAREEEIRSVVENALTPIFILDADQKILFGNQAAIECFGYRSSELQMMRFPDILSHRPKQLATDGGNAVGMTKSGQSRILDLQCNNWVTSDGGQRITAVVRDLTDESEAQQELKNTKTLYDMALRGAQIGVFDIDLITGRSEVSDTWLDIMGFDDPVPGMDTQAQFVARIHPDDLRTLQEADARCIEGHTSRSICEYRVRFGEQGWRWMRSDAVVVERDDAGKALRMIGTQTDVTDLRHSRNALEASEKRFRQVVSAAPIGMALINEDGIFEDVNDALCTLAGCSADELRAKGQLSDFLEPAELKRLFRGVREIMQAGSGAVYQSEHRLINKSGERRWGLINVSWTYDKNVQANFFIAQINDITDQKKLEQTKNEFVSTVSHELRTPLTSIKGALGLIHAAEGHGMSDNSRRLIDIARSNTDRLTTIVNDILDLEKISSGEVAFDFHTVDMGELAQDVAQEMSPFAITHNNTLKVDVPDHPVLADADLGRTKQVLANLISNACKYSSEGSEVTIKVERQKGVALICVQNFGPGIPASFKPRIFHAFSQADGSDTREKGGTGLGLNITKQIVHRHDGDIGYESIPDRLTVFWFTYPLSRVAAERLPLEEKRAAVFTDRGTRLRVLHVEDDRDFAEVIKTGLQPIADVTQMQTIAEARAYLAASEVDVVILDWTLPDGDATVLLDEIAENTPEVRILALSADGDMRSDRRLSANLVKSRTELATLLQHVSGDIARAS